MKIRLKFILKLIALSLFSGCLLSCRSEPPLWKQHHFAELDINKEMGPTLLPRSLWTKILVSFYGDEYDESSQSTLPSVFAPLKLYFVEKNHGILLRGHTVVEFSAGGGEIDLSEIIARKNGSFYLAAEFLPELDDVKRRIFYLSGGVQRQIGREIVGAGCDSYFEITKFFSKVMKDRGLMLNTSDGRHVNALAGTYFFIATNKEKLYLSVLAIKDSTYRAALCNP